MEEATDNERKENGKEDNDCKEEKAFFLLPWVGKSEL
jgi:hypothetical protein